MRIPSAPRRTGARNKPVHFSYFPTERGQPYEAYLAGPVWWGMLHMLRPSKPCVYELTGGNIACRFCGEGKKRVAVMKGWVPLYRKIDGQAICVPVDEVQRDDLDALKCFTKVTVGRCRGKGAGVFVTSCLNQEPAWTSTLPERSEPADITESLINMWALPEVLAFFCRDPHPTKATARFIAEQVIPEEVLPAADRPSGQGAVDDALSRTLKRVKQAEKNGDGKH